jgi:hypothetical protein
MGNFMFMSFVAAVYSVGIGMVGGSGCNRLEYIHMNEEFYTMGARRRVNVLYVWASMLYL